MRHFNITEAEYWQFIISPERHKLGFALRKRASQVKYEVYQAGGV
jgi:hypothetical protein